MALAPCTPSSSPRSVEYASADPVEFSFVTKANILPLAGRDRNAPGVVGKLAELVEPTI